MRFTGRLPVRGATGPSAVPGLPATGYEADNNPSNFAGSDCFDRQRVKMPAYNVWVGELWVKEEQESVIRYAGVFESSFGCFRFRDDFFKVIAFVVFKDSSGFAACAPDTGRQGNVGESRPGPHRGGTGRHQRSGCRPFRSCTHVTGRRPTIRHSSSHSRRRLLSGSSTGTQTASSRPIAARSSRKN